MAKDELDLLKNFIYLNEQIDYLEWSILWSKKEYERWETGEMSKIDVQRNSRIKGLGKEIIKLETKLEKLNKQREEIIKLMNIFEGIEYQVIQLKYIKGMTFNEIAEETSYSLSYILKKHSEIKNILKYVGKYKNELKT